MTSFEFRPHAVASVLGGAVLHPLEAAPRLLSFFREFGPDLPDELSAGPNYGPLVEVKCRYDPGNQFRLNQNIVP